MILNRFSGHAGSVKAFAHVLWTLMIGAQLATITGCGGDDDSSSMRGQRTERDGAAGSSESCDDLDCGDNASCVEDDDDATCECDDGYAMNDDDECVDIDECEDDSDNSCDENATCENTEGDYGCTCNDGFDGDGFTCTAVEVMDGGTGEDNPCPSGQVGDDDGEECWCDLSGYWAVRQDVTFTIPEQKISESTLLIAETTTRSSVWELYRYDYDGEVIKVQKKGCGADEWPRALSPVYEETYSAGVPFETFDALDLQDGVDIEVDKAQPGDTFTTPSEAALLGIEMDDPMNDPWPETRHDVDASMWADSDDDGQPGWTMWHSEPICPEDDRPDPEDTRCYTPVENEPDSTVVRRRASCVSLATRIITHVDVELTACSRMTGEITNESSEARVHSCLQIDSSDWNTPIDCDADAWIDGIPCGDAQVDDLDGQDQSQTTNATFEAVKLGGLDADADCAMVRERLEAIERD